MGFNYNKDRDLFGFHQQHLRSPTTFEVLEATLMQRRSPAKVGRKQTFFLYT